jgi:hypothetical protein
MNRHDTKHGDSELAVKRRIGTAIAVAAWLFLWAAAQPARADDITSREYHVKAAFVYNFLKFVDWPKAKMGDSNEPIVISIIGDDVFQDAFDVLEQKTVDGREVTVKHFKGLERLEKAGQKDPSGLHPEIVAIRKSHLLFVCPSEKQRKAEILKSVEGHNILTVADTEGFLEAGGIINLLMEDEKVRFEVNLTTAKQADLQIRSKLLRLAKRTYPPSEK